MPKVVGSSAYRITGQQGFTRVLQLLQVLFVRCAREVATQSGTDIDFVHSLSRVLHTYVLDSVEGVCTI